MKRHFPLIGLLFLVGILLSGCTSIAQLLNPTPPPPPVGENADWSVKIVSIEKFVEPVEFQGLNYDPTNKHSFLSLQEKNSYIRITAQIINKTEEPRNVADVKIGLLVNSLYTGCGGVTMAGTDYCLPSGMIRDGVNYVNYGIDTPDFNEYLTFEPNLPEGETMVFVFIIKNRARYWDFYFDNLAPLNIKKIKAINPEHE